MPNAFCVWHVYKAALVVEFGMRRYHSVPTTAIRIEPIIPYRSSSEMDLAE